MMLSAGEQEALRGFAEHALMSLCSIKRLTKTSDNAGGHTSVYNTVYTNVKCRLSPVRNDFEQERLIAERLGAQTTWILSVPVNTDIRLNDKIRINGDDADMDVRAVMTDPRSIVTVTRVVVAETK